MDKKTMEAIQVLKLSGEFVSESVVVEEALTHLITIAEKYEKQTHSAQFRRVEVQQKQIEQLKAKADKDRQSLYKLLVDEMPKEKKISRMDLAYKRWKDMGYNSCRTDFITALKRVLLGEK